MVTRNDPGLYRRQVRTSLRDARTTAGRTQLEAAAALDWSLSKVIRIEAGNVGVSTTDLLALLTYYGVTDQDLIDSLVAAARASRLKPWWQEYHEVIRPQFAQLLSYETGASAVWTYSPTMITALLQTADYARAVRSEGVADQHKRDQLVHLLLRRQEIFEGDDAPEAHFIVDEAALRRWVGGPAVMAEQLGHLLECMGRPRISIQVLPFSAGANPSLSGPFVLLRLPDSNDDVVFLEGNAGDMISHEDEEMRSKYFEYFERLTAKCLSQDASATFIRAVQLEFAHGPAN